MANSVEIIIRALDATKGGFASATRNLTSFGKATASAMAASAAIAVTAGAAFTTMAKRFADSADEIGKLSEKTGIATEDLSRLKFVAEENSIEWGTFQKALRSASDEAAKSGQSFTQLLNSQADRFASLADGAGKAAEAQRIFGKSGADLIPLLNLGSEGLAKATKDAERFATIIDGQTAATADEFGDTLERVGASLRKALGDGMKQALPFMLEMSRNFLALVDNLRDADGSFTTFGQTIAGVGKGLALVSQVGLNAATAMKGIGSILKAGFFDADNAKGLEEYNTLLRKMEDGWTRLEKIWDGDIELPAPKSSGALPEMSNTKDSEKLSLMYEDLFNSQLNGSAKVTSEFESAHKKRMDQVLQMQVTIEEGAKYEALSAATVETQKAEFYRTGLAMRADMDTAYALGSTERAALILSSEQAVQSARLENNQALIDIQIEQWRKASESFKVQWARVGVSIQDGALAGVQRGMEGILKGTMKASEAMKALGQAIIDSVVSAFTQMIAKLLIMKTLGFIFGGGGFLGDIFGFKGGGFTGFAGGGYTGNGGTSDIAGVVHRREYVVPAAATSAIGVSALDRMTAAAEAGMVASNSYSGGSEGQPMSVSMFLDGQVLARALGVMSRDGTLELSASAIV